MELSELDRSHVGGNERSDELNGGCGVLQKTSTCGDLNERLLSFS